MRLSTNADLNLKKKKKNVITIEARDVRVLLNVCDQNAFTIVSKLYPLTVNQHVALIFSSKICARTCEPWLTLTLSLGLIKREPYRQRAHVNGPR